VSFVPSWFNLSGSPCNEDEKKRTLARQMVILTAVDRELLPIVRLLSLRRERGSPWYTGASTGCEVWARFTGMGQRATTDALRDVAERFDGAHVIHAGFAGGLDPSLRTGDVIEARWILGEGGMVATLSDGLPRIARDDAGSSSRDSKQTLITVDRVIDSVAKKRSLWESSRACAVEMESFYAAALAAELGLPLTVLRAISDEATVALPAQATNWVRADGVTDTFAAARYALTHPWRIPQLIKLGSDASKAGRALAVAVERVLMETLAPAS
jgi:nucleoside phosphorylase